MAKRYPENPCPSPGIDGIGNYCRAPFKITTSGWYTFRHIYRIDPSTHNLSIEFQVVPQAGGSPVVDQTIYGWQGHAQAPAGGIMPAYGWFANQEIPELAIDNSLLKDFDALALSPTNPSPLGAGTIQTFTLSATLFGVADPLTPGLTPANVTFTQSNTDTGSVTVVPSGTQPGNGTFSFDATGGVIGSVNLTANIDTFASNTVSLNVIAPALYSPVNGSTLPGSAVTFYWTEYPGATAYWLDVGATPGGNAYAQSGSLSSSTLSYTVNTLPTDGSTVYATWYSLVNGSWRHSDYSYTAYTAGSSKGVITSPVPGSTLTGSTVNFIWTLGNGATNYWIDAGSTVGGNQYFQSGPLGNVNTKTVTGLPTDGSTVYVTLYSLVGGTWLNNQYTYTAYSVVVGPPPVSFLTAVNYGAGSGPDSVAAEDFNGDGKLDLATANYASGNVSVLIGNGNGTFQPAVNYAAGPGANSVSVADFNGDGKLDLAVADRNSNNVSVLLGNGDGTFQPPANYGVGASPAASAAGDFNGDGKPDIATANYGANSVSILLSNTAFQGPAIVYSPAPNSTLPGPSVTFQWTPSDSATAYWIDVGSSAGGNQYYQSGSLLTTTLSATVNGLPLNGSAVYATMYSLIGGQWVHNSYTYTVFTGSSKGVITTPANGSTFTGSTVTFGWTAGAGASSYWLDAGSTPFGNNYYQSGNLGNVLTTTVSGLPSDGSTVYVTLYSYVGGQWLSNSYTYTAFTPIVTLGVMQTPIPGSTLSGNTATFTWSAGVGATAYWLEVGSSPGGNQYYQSGNLGNVLTTTTYTLPQNGSTVYATLYSYIGGQWLSNSYTYGSAMAFQGFETDIGDWQPITTRVASGGGVLGVSSASGSYHAELTNVYDTYGTGYGGAEYSLFGYATQPPYPGDFSQSISMYIDKNWPTASPNGNGVGVWIDMSPGNPDPNNYGAEHNFRFTPSGTAVAVSVDGQGSPIATITTSGWYKFQMTYQKGALPTDLVITNMNVFDSTGHLVGTTTVLANSPGGPLLSENLLGPGYVWITVWADGWPAAGANDVLAIDDVRADLL